MDVLASSVTCGEVMSRWWQSRRVTKALLAGGIVAGGIYALGDLVSGLLYDGYSFRDQAISELTAFGSPVRPLMLATMIVHSVPLLAFAFGLWRVSDRTSVRAISALLVAAGIGWLPNHMIWAMSSRSMEGGFNDDMHQIVSSVWVLMMTVAIVLSAVAMRGWFRAYGVGTLVVFLGFGAAAGVSILGIDQDVTPWAGGFERISCYAYFLWLAVLAAILIRRSPDSIAAPRSLTGIGATGPVLGGR